MKKGMLAVMCVVMLSGFTFQAQASDQKIEPQKVVDTVKTAVQLIVEKGAKDAFPLLSDPNGKYVDGDLYVFTYNMDGTIIQHLRPALVGKNMMNVKDQKGKCLACDFVRIARDEGSGWSQYYWPKPSTNKLSVKVSYIMKVPGQEMFVGAGVYDITKEQAEAAMKTSK